MDVTISRKPPLRLAYTRATGPYQQSSREAWDKMIAWAAPKGLLTPDTKFIGIGHDDPSATAPELLRYDACITVGPAVEGDGEVVVWEVPGGEYASVIHKGAYDQLEKTYKWFYKVWLPTSGRGASPEQVGYEIYLNDPRTTAAADLLTEINMLLEEK